MATTTSLTTTYAGEAAGGFILPAFLSAESINNITVKSRVPGKMVIRRMEDDATAFQTPACTFTPGGTVTIDERILTLVDMSLERELCKLTFLQDWEALAAQNGNINNVADALIQTMMGKIGAISEVMLWHGVAGTNSFAGLITQMDVDADVHKVGSPEAITESNVVAKIKLLIAELPTRVKRAIEKPVIYAATNVIEAYQNSQSTLGNNNMFNQGEAIRLRFNGLYDIIEAPGMNDSTMVFAQKSNLWFGTNETSDFNSIKTIDMEPVNMDKTVRFGADFFGATNYGWSDEIAIYGPGLS